MKKYLSCILAAVFTLSSMMALPLWAEEAEVFAQESRIRTVITTDLEIDDMDSIIHLLLYANDFEIEGIVSTSSTLHFVGDGEHTVGEIIESYAEDRNYKDLKDSDGVNTAWIYDLITNEYAEVYPNLIKHDSRYSSPEELAAVVKEGNIIFPGDMREETEGSELIKDCILKEDDRILYLQAWGGVNTIGRALMSIEEEYQNEENWAERKQAISEKLVLLSYGDQDNVYATYVQENWPGIEMIHCLFEAYVYATPANCPPAYRYLFQSEWMTENIKFNHGALMSKYYLLGDGSEEHIWSSMEAVNDPDVWLYKVRGEMQQYEFISEGDSGCYMYLIPVGLRGRENPAYGSWGGRMQDGSAIKEFDPAKGAQSGSYSSQRWLEAYNNDWAARADWCVAEYEDANHQPQVYAEFVDFEAEAKESVSLSAAAVDPDGDELSYHWFVYKDACSYSGEFLPYLDVVYQGTDSTEFVIPKDAESGDYFNIILEVSDGGSPSLTRYAQYIVTVK